MLYIDSIWEYIVNFLELALFIIFIHKKLRIRANYKHQAVLMFLFVSFQFAVLCTLNKMGISSYSTLMSSCVLDIGYAVLFYRDSIIRRIFWGFSYSIICLVAEQISFFIPVTLYKGASLELLLGGTLRKPYTMLYLAMIAVFVLLFHSIGNKDISLSPFQKVAYIFIAISGLAIGHYILRLTLESVDKFGDSSFSARLSLVDLFFIILFLVLMLYIYQLGYSKEENIRLLEEQKIYELERTEFNSIICLVAEQISFFIPVTLYKGASLELLLGGTLRKPYTMLYLAMIAVFVLLFHSIGNKDISLSPFQKVAYIFIAISGLAIGHYILRLTLESVDKFGDSSFSARLSLVDLFFIILFLVLMLYIYQLGYSKEENIRLLEEQKIYELERTEFNSLSETTERLRKMKHDMQIYVDAINVLAKDKKWDELIAYTEQYHNTLATTQSAIATGNIAIDCILTAKLDYAEKHGIKTEYSIMAPENFPLDSVELSSILGNIWNNSIEAGERLIISDPTEHPYIYFYIKPYQNMILIHIENNYDGVIKGSIDGDILSVKQGNEHGLGIRRVKELVEKADGVLQITSDNKIFSVHIMIPDKENNKLL